MRFFGAAQHRPKLFCAQLERSERLRHRVNCGDLERDQARRHAMSNRLSDRLQCHLEPDFLSRDDRLIDGSRDPPRGNREAGGVQDPRDGVLGDDGFIGNQVGPGKGGSLRWHHADAMSKVRGVARQMRVLSNLESQGTLIASLVVALTAMDKALVSRVLTMLHRRRLVRSSAPKSDPRRRRSQPRRAGRNLVDRLQPEWRRREAVIQAGLADRNAPF